MKYAYIEITERCNFQCPFCPSAKITDPRVEMSEELFTNVLQNLQGNVQEIVAQRWQEILRPSPESVRRWWIIGMAAR